METGPPPSIARPKHVDARIVWLFYGTGALLALVLAGTALWTPGSIPQNHRNGMALLGVGQALAFVVSALIALRLRVGVAVVFSCITAMAAITAASLMTASDVVLHLLSFLGFLVCLCGVFAGRRAALATAAGAFGAVALVTTLRPGQSVLAIAISLILIATGLLIGLLCTMALNRTVLALRQREQRFQGLLNIAADRYWELDDQLRFNRMTSTETGASPDDPSQKMGLRPWETPHLAPSAEVWAEHRRACEAREAFRDFHIRQPDLNGKPVHVSVSGQPIFDDAGRFTGYWGIVRNITPQVLNERTVLASATRYRQLFERSPSPMLLHRLGVALDANVAIAQLLGYPDVQATIGRDLSEHFIDAPVREASVARTRLLIESPVEVLLPAVEARLSHLDGRRIDVQLTSLRVDLDDGPAVLTICQDLTARKAAELALRQSQTLLERLFDTTPDVVLLTEHQSGRYLMVNNRFTQMLGWKRDDVIGRTANDLGLYQNPLVREAMHQQLRDEGSLRDTLLVFRAKSGALVPLRISAALLSLDGIDYVVAVGRDVSQTEQTRQELEAILKYASVGIGFTRARYFVQVNPRFEEMFGWPVGSLAGEPGSAVWPSEEDDAEVGVLAGPLLAAGQPFETERLMRRRDGSSFWCRMSVRVVDPEDPSRGGTLWITEDITERRLVQESLAAARDAAEAASRAKSAFLANTSHEIRTPLNALLGLARLARRPELPDADRLRYLDQILDSARNLSGVITDTLDLSKIEAGRLSLETVAFDLRVLLEALCNSTETLAQARGLRMRREIDPGLPAAVRGDPVRVRQILGNFLNNALKFTERGEISLTARRGPGELVHVVVADTGTGIDETTQARLFRPFVQADTSTTRRYGGTGLGLSICRELATLMGGAVGVSSQPRRGSRFWADLPLPAVDAAELGGAEPSGFDAPVAGARVLVVEDNAVNLLIVRALLEGWGIDVSEATDGQQALDVVARSARQNQPFDAVLMDVQMPVMSGHDAARTLRQRPEGATLPIIALTAAALVSERDQALAAGMDAFLTKPIDAGVLRQTLARVMAERQPG